MGLNKYTCSENIYIEVFKICPENHNQKKNENEMNYLRYERV